MNLSALKTIDTGAVVLESDGANSVLNLAGLTSFTETNDGADSTLQASNGGAVDDGNLASLSNADLQRRRDRRGPHARRRHLVL